MKPILTGADLKAMGLKPGPQFRKILDRLLDTHLNDEIKMEQEERQLVQEVIYLGEERMACPEVSKDTAAIKALSLFLLLWVILLTQGGCSLPAHPLYQPLSIKNILSAPWQGHRDIPIDERTYFVYYRGYYSNNQRFYLGWDDDALLEKWLQGAQEYALYRAGELAKSKGANYFVIFYKDDWNLESILEKTYKRGPIIRVFPSAGLIIRILRDLPSSVKPDDDRIYAVDNLLQSLREKNSGLPLHQVKHPPAELIKNTENGYNRWRLSVSGYDPVPDPWQWKTTVFGQDIESGTRNTKELNDTFQVVRWAKHFEPTMPLTLLRDCVLRAEKMGLKAFRLTDWTVEEHRDTGLSLDQWRVWFRTTATAIPQHYKESDSLDPVFVVDEIRSNVMNYDW